MPAWNFVNGTTPDATADGRTGVIIEPDLIPGTWGIDGAHIRRRKSGKSRRPVPAFEMPCSSCYITAEQLDLSYPNGRIANVDTGAW
jgi:hypothetical protein